MLSILATGTLVADPRRRTSATGKDYATASLRVPAEDAEAMLVSLIAFNADAVAVILAPVLSAYTAAEAIGQP